MKHYALAAKPQIAAVPASGYIRPMPETPAQTLAIAIGQLNPVMGDIAGNLEKARAAHAEARAAGADLLVLTELFLCGYSPEDLVLKPAVQIACREAAEKLAADTEAGPGIVVGCPWVDEGGLHNSVLLLEAGKIAAIRHKVELPNYGVFDEMRVFKPGPPPGPVSFRGIRLGLPICEDIWLPDVCETLSETGAELLIVPNGSPYWKDKSDLRMQIAVARVVETGLPLIFVNQVGGQDELVFDGGSFGLNADRTLAFQMQQFETGLVLTRWEQRDGVLALHRRADGDPSVGRFRQLARLRARPARLCGQERLSAAWCWGFRAASIPPSARRWPSMRSARNACTPSCCPTATPPQTA